MNEVRGPWNSMAVNEFLTTNRIPLRLSMHRGDGSLWMVSLWYRYHNGLIECATAASADAVKFLENEPQVAFEISTNEPPYRGIRGCGEAQISRDAKKETLKSLINRYLGNTDSTLAKWLLSDERSEVRLRIEPHEIVSWDFSKRMTGIDSATSAPDDG